VDLELHQLERRHADLRIRADGRRRRALLASLSEYGQQVPVVVVVEGERYVLIDGYLRVELLAQLGHDIAAATAWPQSEAEALLHHHHLGAASRSALEEGWLLSRLREHGLSQEDLARRLCRSKSWVSRRLALLAELSAATQARVRAGTIPPHAAMKYLVPLARANRTHAEALVTSLGKTHVSDRDVAALYDGWRRADAEGRKRLLDDPGLFLRAVRAHESEPAADKDPGLLKELTTLSAVAWRARQRVVADGLGVTATYQRMDIRGAWRSAESAFDALRRTWKETWLNAGPDHESDHPQAP
jgi:ParB-like chromosome segregation protein Spo0J